MNLIQSRSTSGFCRKNLPCSSHTEVAKETAHGPAKIVSANESEADRSAEAVRHYVGEECGRQRHGDTLSERQTKARHIALDLVDRRERVDERRMEASDAQLWWLQRNRFSDPQCEETRDGSERQHQEDTRETGAAASSRGMPGGAPASICCAFGGDQWRARNVT